MNEPNTAATHPDRRGRRLAVVMAALLIVPTLVSWAWVEWQLACELARCRAAGESITLADLSAEYERWPIDEAATQAWQNLLNQTQLRAFAIELSLPQTNVWNPQTQAWEDTTNSSPVPVWTADQVAGAKRIVTKHQATFDEARRVATGPVDVRFPQHFELGYQMPLDYIAPLRTVSRCLETLAEIDAAEGNAIGSCQAVDGLLNCPIVLQRDPHLTSILIGCAIHEMTGEQICRRIEQRLVDEETCLRWQTRLGEQDGLAWARLVLIGERVVLDDVAQHAPGSEFNTTIWWRSAERLCLLEHQRDTIAAAGESWERLIQAASDQDARVMQITRGLIQPPVSPCGITLMTLPAIHSAITRFAEHQQQVNALRVAIAVERFRLQKSALPEKLEDLTPDWLTSLPLDLFTGRPLRYRVTQKDWIVYGSTSKGADHGGTLRDEAAAKGELFKYDLGVRISR